MVRISGFVIWSKVGECFEEGFHTTVVWTKAHTTFEANMLPKIRQVFWATEKADEVPERIAKYDLDTRKKVYAAIRYAAIFRDGVEELLAVEEVSEEDMKKLERLFGSMEAEGRKHRMVRAVGGKKKFQCKRCGKLSRYIGTVFVAHCHHG